MDTASRPLLLRTTLRGVLLGTVLLGTVLLGVSASPACAEAIDADHNRTKSMIRAYESAPNWVVKAMALLALGERWHPEGNRIVLDALRCKDRRLQAFGLEAYRGVAPTDLRVLLRADVLDVLIGRHGKERHRFFRSYLNILLSRAFPKAADAGKGWRAWWADAQEGYAPPAWKEQPPQKPGPVGPRTTARKSVVTRALELSQDGIELVLVLDSTGSMQPTIDAARAAMTPLLEILEGLSSDLSVGLVHYKDRGDLGGGSSPDAGAEVKVRLLHNLRSLKKHLGRLRASGGGDLPERVYGGLWLALQPSMGWTLPACKMVVLIGDAPPHTETEKVLDLVRQAREDPVGQLAPRRRRGAAPTTGRGKRSGKRGRTPEMRIRPIFTSAIWTGPAPVTRSPDGDDPARGHGDWGEGAEVFQRIAHAGGGVFAVLRRTSGPSGASARIVSHLVSLTFGVEHADVARRLAERYMFWRSQAFIK